MMARLLGMIVMSLLVAPIWLASSVMAEGQDKPSYQFAVQGGIYYGQARSGETVTLDDQPVKVTGDGRFVIGFPYDRTADAVLKFRSKDGSLRGVEVLEIKPRKFNVEHVNGLPPKTVSPPPEWASRRKVETGRVRAARAKRTDDMNWWQGFIRPAEGRYSGFYGSQRILNGKPRSPHYGLDIANRPGTPIVAPAGGVVRLSAPDFLLEGGIVIIDHGFGVTSTLFHMKSVSVNEGQRVKQGDPIGTIGATGRASGPHVDWRLNWKNVRLDPGLVVGLNP